MRSPRGDRGRWSLLLLPGLPGGREPGRLLRNPGDLAGGRGARLRRPPRRKCQKVNFLPDFFRGFRLTFPPLHFLPCPPRAPRLAEIRRERKGRWEARSQGFDTGSRVLFPLPSGLERGVISQCPFLAFLQVSRSKVCHFRADRSKEKGRTRFVSIKC